MTPQQCGAAAPRTRRRRLRCAVLACVSTLASLTLTAPPAAAAEPPVACHSVQVPVSLGGAPGQISGTLCAPEHAHTLQVLVPGFSYNRSYWDWPQKPDTYSYVRQAHRAGYATLALDRPGTGSSTHPPSVLDTFENQVDALHQAIQALRRTQPRFTRVALTGHSYGSIVSMREIGRYHDVDALVITGGGHRYNAINLTQLIVGAPPASLSPDAPDAAARLDVGYVLPTPQSRDLMHAPGQTEPDVRAADRAHRDTGTLPELLTAPQFPLLGMTRDVNVPVFTINGSRDAFFCDPGITVPPVPMSCPSGAALAARERGEYGPRAQVEASVVPEAGHDLNLERAAPSEYTQIIDFLNRHLGP